MKIISEIYWLIFENTLFEFKLSDTNCDLHQEKQLISNDSFKIYIEIFKRKVKKILFVDFLNFLPWGRE